ncbi:MAG: ribonuclease Z [Paludibacteraceae bacterium]|nr:ribonuclease Z [Paludibacteraceae bacterium]
MSDNNRIELTVLGRCAALPCRKGNQSGQILSLHNKLMLIDCGEGTQSLLRNNGFSLARINHIFISHLHGDHMLGLPGLLSTLGMLGRKGAISIYAPAELKTYLDQQIAFFGGDFGFPIDFHSFDPFHSELIYEDKTLTVKTIPLKHTMPCCGFLFEEKSKPKHINRERCDFYEVPISQYNNIKAGLDFVNEKGITIPNEQLTTPADAAKKYAYCSDTAYTEKIIPYIYNADCIYHEATFMNKDAKRAKETQHSTAAQAATIALKAGVKKLIIGHISARYSNFEELRKEADAIFKGAILAEEGKTYII